MPEAFTQNGLTIAPSEGRGKGVFAARDFCAGETVEICPAVILEEKWARQCDAVWQLVFSWDFHRCALLLGFGSVYNHSYEPNAAYERLHASGQFRFFALKDIPAGSEVFVNYNGSPKCRDPLWFTVV